VEGGGKRGCHDLHLHICRNNLFREDLYLRGRGGKRERKEKGDEKKKQPQFESLKQNTGGKGERGGKGGKGGGSPKRILYQHHTFPRLAKEEGEEGEGKKKVSSANLRRFSMQGE